MTTITRSLSRVRDSIGRRFRWDYWIKDNVTGSIGLTLWVSLLALVTGLYAIDQLTSEPPVPFWTILILIAWIIFLALAIAGDCSKTHEAGDCCVRIWSAPFLTHC